MIFQEGDILLDKYKIIRSLGSGGWGDVYLVEDTQLGRQVAVKHLRSELTQDKVALGRFLREAQIIAGLKHNNIVTIFALERDEDNHYMFMEYAENGTLEDLITQEGPLSIESALNLISNICLALDIVHAKDIIHRDIKPSNILLFEDSEGNVTPKLADFGIARAPISEQDAKLTAARSVLGTAAYIAPEQAQGKDVDARADIYSMGVVLYEMLTRQLPHTGDYLDLLMGKTDRPPTPLREIRQEIPDALDQLVMKTLAIDPAGRFQTARTMAQALQSLINGVTVMHTPAQLKLIYDQGAQYCEQEEWAEAVKKFTQLVSIDPTYPDAEKRLSFAKEQYELEQLYQQGLDHIQEKRWWEAVSSLGELLKRSPDYKDADRKWREARKQDALQLEYERGLRYFEKKQWEKAVASFEKIGTNFLNYENAKSKLNEAKRQIQLKTLDERATVAMQTHQWSEAIGSLEEIIKLEPKHEQAKEKLTKAKQALELQSLYQRLLRDIKQEEWLAAEDKIKSIEKIHPNYEDLSVLKRRVENNKRWAAWYSDLQASMKTKKWDEAIEIAKKIIRDFSVHASGTYKNVDKLLRKAENRKSRVPFSKKVGALIMAVRQRWRNFKQSSMTSASSEEVARKRRIRISIEVIIGIIGIIIAIFTIPGITDFFLTPKINEFQIFVDGHQIKNGSINNQPINLTELSSLTGGQSIKLKVVVVDTNGIIYTGDDELRCNWGVAPIGSEDEAISTESCEALYIPSRNHSKQTVLVDIQGKKQQFGTVPSITMEFEIRNN